MNEIKFAKTANEEIDSIGTFNPKSTVWIDERFKMDKELTFLPNTDATADIQLTKYHPDRMEYASKSTSGGFVVFSEIWYRGNEDWKLYVNGKPQKLVRCNYLLRGAFIPAGNNKIEMKFLPEKLLNYKSISFWSTILLLLLLSLVSYFILKKK